MLQFLTKYNMVLRESVYWEKLKIHFFNTEAGSQRAIVDLFDVRIGTFLGRFLGTPLFGRAGIRHIWDKLTEDCKNKMES